MGLHLLIVTLVEICLNFLYPARNPLLSGPAAYAGDIQVRVEE